MAVGLLLCACWGRRHSKVATGELAPDDAQQPTAADTGPTESTH